VRGQRSWEGTKILLVHPSPEVTKQGHLYFNGHGLDRERREWSNDGKDGNTFSPLFEDRASAPAINQGSNGVSDTEGFKNPKREAPDSEREKLGEDGRAAVEGEGGHAGERLANNKPKTSSHPNPKGRGYATASPTTRYYQTTCR